MDLTQDGEVEVLEGGDESLSVSSGTVGSAPIKGPPKPRTGVFLTALGVAGHVWCYECGPEPAIAMLSEL